MSNLEALRNRNPKVYLYCLVDDDYDYPSRYVSIGEDPAPDCYGGVADRVVNFNDLPAVSQEAIQFAYYKDGQMEDTFLNVVTLMPEV